MVAKKDYDQNQILKETAALRGAVGSMTASPIWIPIILDPGWSTLNNYAPPSYRVWQDGIHMEFTGIADFTTVETVSHNLNNNNPLPVAPLTTKTIYGSSGNYNTGQRGFVQIFNTGVIEMICSTSMTGRYAEINAIICLDL